MIKSTNQYQMMMGTQIILKKLKLKFFINIWLKLQATEIWNLNSIISAKFREFYIIIKLEHNYLIIFKMNYLNYKKTKKVTSSTTNPYINYFANLFSSAKIYKWAHILKWMIMLSLINVQLTGNSKQKKFIILIQIQLNL